MAGDHPRDRYLYGDIRRRGLRPARRGATATERLTSNFATADGHGLSRKFRSAYSLGSEQCVDMLAGF